jgi:prophage regulatory protein
MSRGQERRISGQTGKRSSTHLIAAQQFIRRKPVQSQKLDEGDQIGHTLDDMSFLRLPDVKAVTGLSKTSLYTLIREKSFPAPVRLGPRAVAWLKSEVRQWAAQRVQASRSVA